MLRRRLLLSAALIMLTLGSLALGQLPDIQKGSISVHLNPIATGLDAPLYGFSPPGDTHRLFVLEQEGFVKIIQDGTMLSTNALDIRTRVQPPLNATNQNDERGLLGLAFHPGFNDPTSPGFRTLYTYNSELIPAGTTPTYQIPNLGAVGNPQNYKNVINEWKISATDPNVIDPSSRREIISFGKNAGNHNGGTIAFGTDGYMYLALGDGGNANDVGPSHIEPTGNAQNMTTPLGKMIRIDPTNPTLKPLSTDPIAGNGQYRIPADNPFTSSAVPEMYALGLRNPYRFAFDRGATHDLILADVGQNTIEEVDRIVKGGNYGWAVKEGTFLFNRVTGPGGNAGTVGANSPGSPAGLIDPISGPGGYLEYDHSDGISITGGFVYRGTAIPELVGKYVFGDLAIRANPQPRIDGRLFYADLEQGTINEFLLPQFTNDQLPNDVTVHGFGEDANGEIYAMVTNTAPDGSPPTGSTLPAHGGIVYRFEAVVPEPTSMALIGLAAAGMLGWARRRR
ncbi:MAG TPA: PQQ-dependent sugar dehydrogenase [Tepidisphaeraceae bacterium]|jgi:glucose/arabinose dehydrogenase|nr:PQQ-dependent sugar dehydrogenase [Tepidisphaeraceae bacterium]